MATPEPPAQLVSLEIISFSALAFSISPLISDASIIGAKCSSITDSQNRNCIPPTSAHDVSSVAPYENRHRTKESSPIDTPSHPWFSISNLTEDIGRTPPLMRLWMRCRCLVFGRRLVGCEAAAQLDTRRRAEPCNIDCILTFVG